MGLSHYPRAARCALFYAAALAACSGNDPNTNALPTLALSPSLHANLSYKTLYAFHGPDGANPRAALTDVNGTLYGTTYYGGARGGGTVFAISTSGEERVVYSFSGGYDGSNPSAGVIQAAGKLYGTTPYGGAGGGGTLFSLTESGTERVLHVFGASGDGAFPVGNLATTKSTPGLLFGTTQYGGPNGGGTVFETNLSGAERPLFGFGGLSSGGLFPASVTAVGGVLYGTEQYGSSNGNAGAVYQLTTLGSERILYSFAAGADGATPVGDVIDANGTLYGATQFGGANGLGTVFSMSTSGAEQVLCSFKGGKDGAYPHAGLIAVKGTLYGTTAYGGRYGVGTIFSVSKSGKERVLYSFAGGADGEYPTASLTAINDAVLYGTTSLGGPSGAGTAFRLSL